jgi:microcystin-dependent protein
MANFPNQQLTDAGWDALSEALGGKRLTFVRMVVGSGQMEPGETLEELAARTELIHYVMDVPITDWRAVGQGKMFITGTLRSSQVATGFQMREIGLYCTLTPQGSETPGPEILYSLNNAGEEFDYVPGRGEGTVVIQAIEVQVIISKAEEVVVEVVLGEVGLEGENLGTGAPVFIERQGNRFRFRSIKGVTTGLIPVTITQAGDEISVGAQLGTGGGNGTGGGDDGSGAAPPNAIAPGVGVIETGMIVPFGGNIAPRGYLVCNGRAVSRTGYAGLYAVIGTRYGSESGTTFNLPDCRSRTLFGASDTFLLGSSFGNFDYTLTEAQIPAHTHTVNVDHYHSLSTVAHGHGDPGHTHPDPTHNHYCSGANHNHNVTMQNKYGAHWVGTGYALEEAGARGTTTNSSGAFWANGNYAGLWASGTGIQNAGALGGNTAWMSAMSTNNHIRTTDPHGGGQPIRIVPPGLGINYIIKT